ncbi:MAG: WecB/TagA/CpsF family glycosyltransferase [Patescibacteria group bacterium]|jgi:N-acetylglucosaminyldiphosphoundecaprenol N-acetyl-beta-D-mannosaminyltransferase
MVNILGVNIITDSKQEILKKISGFLDGKKTRHAVTPNPEFLLAAKEDEEFFYILNKADIAIPDGIGLVFAGLFMGKKIKRVSGVDLMYDICALAEKQDKSIFLLGGENNAAHEAGLRLKELYPGLKIVGAESGLAPGSWKIERGRWIKGKNENQRLIEKINKAKPDIIFVAFGQMKQEKWAWHSAPEIPSVKLTMGVGGSFDFIAGKIRRAPKIMRAAGLEWLWRLLQEPFKRLPRIYNAVVVFPLAFFRWRFINPLRYRPNIACLLYKRENDKIKILIAERRIPAGHWQLPQGGTDGEKLEIVGSRELREEAGTDNFKPIKVFKNLHRYKFGDELTRGGVKSKQILGYKGQKQGLFIAEFTGKDKDITINYWDHRNWKWVDAENLVKEVDTYRKESAKIFLDKFETVISNQ